MYLCVLEKITTLRACTRYNEVILTHVGAQVCSCCHDILHMRSRFAALSTVYIFPKFGKHIICSWKNNILKINMFIQLEVYISIQEFSLFGGEQSFSVYTK